MIRDVSSPQGSKYTMFSCNILQYIAIMEISWEQKVAACTTHRQ